MLHPLDRFAIVEHLSQKIHRDLDRSLQAAKELLDTAPGQGPYVIASNVSEARFAAWDDDSSPKAAWGLAYGAAERSILLCGDTGHVHAFIVGYLQTRIHENVLYLFRQTNPDKRLSGMHCAGKTTLYCEHGAKSPDVSWYPNGFDDARSVVIELAHRNESLGGLRDEVDWWHTAGVGLAIGVFIDVHSDPADPRLVLLTHSRSGSLVQRSFGKGSGCGERGLARFQLKIPVNHLVQAQCLPPDVASDVVLIDLFDLRTRILRELQCSLPQ